MDAITRITDAITRPDTGGISLHTHTGLGAQATRAISGALNVLLADLFASLIESWIDDAERRAWFLFETIRR